MTKVKINSIVKVPNGKTYYIALSNTVNCSNSKINRMKSLILKQINEINKVSADTPVIIQHDGFLEQFMDYYQSKIKFPHYIGNSQQVVDYINSQIEEMA